MVEEVIREDAMEREDDNNTVVSLDKSLNSITREVIFCLDTLFRRPFLGHKKSQAKQRGLCTLGKESGNESESGGS